MRNLLFFSALACIFFSSCLPREVREHIPPGVEDKKAYVINSLKARAKLNELVQGQTESETRRIDTARANQLRGQLSGSPQFNSTGVFFHFPTLIQALMTAKGVNKAEDLLLDSRNFDLRTSGFYAVFGRYPPEQNEDHPGRLTCYISFAYKDLSGKYWDIFTPESASSGSNSFRSDLNREPLMFNFGTLCPDNCPQSLGGN